MKINLLIIMGLIGFGSLLSATDLSNPFVEDYPHLPGALTAEDVNQAGAKVINTLVGPDSLVGKVTDHLTGPDSLVGVALEYVKPQTDVQQPQVSLQQFEQLPMQSNVNQSFESALSEEAQRAYALQRLQDIDNMIEQQKNLEYQSMLMPPPAASPEQNSAANPAFSTSSQSEEIPAPATSGQQLSPNAIMLGLLAPLMLPSTPTPAEMAMAGEQVIPNEALQAYLHNAAMAQPVAPTYMDQLNNFLQSAAGSWYRAPGRMMQNYMPEMSYTPAWWANLSPEAQEAMLTSALLSSMAAAYYNRDTIKRKYQQLRDWTYNLPNYFF